MSDERVERALRDLASGESTLGVDAVMARVARRRRRSLALRVGALTTALALVAGVWSIARDDSGPSVEVLPAVTEFDAHLVIARSDTSVDVVDQDGVFVRSLAPRGDFATDVLAAPDGSAVFVRRESGDDSCPKPNEIDRIDLASGDTTAVATNAAEPLLDERGSVLVYRRDPGCGETAFELWTVDLTQGAVSSAVRRSEPGGSNRLRPIVIEGLVDGTIWVAHYDEDLGTDVAQQVFTPEFRFGDELFLLPRDGEYATDAFGARYAAANTSEMGLSLLALSDSFAVRDTLVELPPGGAGDLAVDPSGDHFAIVIIDAEGESALYTWTRGDTEPRKLLEGVESAAWLPAVTELPSPTSTTVESTTVPPFLVPTPTTVPDGVGSWAPMSDAPLAGRRGHRAVWTGTEMIVWGGSAVQTTPEPPEYFADGAAYDPETNSWRVIAPSPLTARSDHYAAWTGSEMLIVGGSFGANPGIGFRDDGAAYNPTTDSWRTIATPPIPIGSEAAVTWTGSDLFIYGGRQIVDKSEPGAYFSQGALYNPATDAWRMVASWDGRGRSGPAVAWTGSEVIVYGGGIRVGEAPPEGDLTEVYRDAAAYSPESNSWRALADGPAAANECCSTAIAAWRGDSMFVWYANPYRGPYFAIYDRGADRWVEYTHKPDLGHYNGDGANASTGTGFVFWGGAQGEGANRSWNDGAIFDSASGSWERLALSGLDARSQLSGVWTGTQFLVWGGFAMTPDPDVRYYAAADGAILTL